MASPRQRTKDPAAATRGSVSARTFKKYNETHQNITGTPASEASPAGRTMLSVRQSSDALWSSSSGESKQGDAGDERGLTLRRQWK